MNCPMTTKQKYTPGSSATFFLDELFSEPSTNQQYQRKSKQSPRVYRFNPETTVRGRAPTATPTEAIRGRSF